MTSHSNNNYFVEDLIPSNTKNMKVLFIFESPYKKELEHRHPIAGGSGKSVGKFLNKIVPEIPTDIPFGCYLKKSKDSRFAAVNCCNYPMDKEAYPGDLKIIDNLYIDKLDRLRLKLSQSNKLNINITETFNLLADKFEYKLNKLNHNSVLKVFCGKFAQNFYSCCGNNLNINALHVPHPSRNQWSHKRYADVIQNMLEKIREIL
ncbi:MAG TPA: hypothetical protein QF753_19475 [Victivallales bacterium]|nr:hypothetical protein [Victivallales bacterium]